jgi:hypothetical protein
MMTSTSSATNRSSGSARSGGTLVLDPPRHMKLPTTFLGPGKHFIGTHGSCSIQVDAAGIQPRHAMILVGDQATLLKALDDKVWINDSIVAEAVLRPGDRLSIGPITFRVRLATNDERLKPAPVQERPESPGPSAPALKPHPVRLDFDDLDIEAGLRNRDAASPAEMLRSVLSQTDMRPAEASTSDIIDFVHDFAAKSEQTRHRPERAPLLTDGALPPSGIVTADHQRFEARQAELAQLAADLSLQSQRLQDLERDLTARETEVQRGQQLLDSGNERLADAATFAHRELADAHSRQLVQMQEWDTTFQRSLADVTRQLEGVDRQRVQIQTEHARLSAERIEFDRLQAEHDQDFQAGRDQFAGERAGWETQRTAFETEREQQLAALREQETVLADGRRTIAAAHDELLALRQQLELDRTLLATECKAESHRRENEALSRDRERTRLEGEAHSLRMMRLDLETEKSDLEEQRAGLKRDREELELARAAVDEIRRNVVQAETEVSARSATLKGEQVERLAADTLAFRRKNDIDEWQRTIEAQQVRLEATRTSLQIEQQELATARAQLTSDRNELTADLQARRIAFEDAQLTYEPDVTPAPPRSLEHSPSEMAGLSIPAQSLMVADPVQLDVLALPSHETALPESLLPEASPKVPERGEPPEFELASPLPVPVDGSPGEPEVTNQPALTGDSLSSLTPLPEQVSANSPPEPSSLSIESLAPVPPPIPMTDWSDREDQNFPRHGDFKQLLLSEEHEVRKPFTNMGLGAKSEGGSAKVEARVRNLPAAESTDDTTTSLKIGSGVESTAVSTTGLASVEDTLSVVNQRFGFPAVTPEKRGPNDAHAEIAESVVEERSTSPETLSSSQFDEKAVAIPEPADVAIPASGPSLTSLRAQLARMFDLPGGTSADDAAASADPQLLASDDQQATPADTHTEPSQDLCVGDSTSADNSSKISIDPSVTGMDAESGIPEGQAEIEPDADDPWVLRLRQLAEAAGTAEHPPAPLVVPPPAVDNRVEAVDADDEYSVEAQLARLLGRPRMSGATRTQSSAPTSTGARNAEEKTVESVAEVGSPELVEVPEADRAHLMKGPRHRQDKSAVRDEVRSFRAVAQMSARSALAKHSWDTLRNEVYFTGCLTAVSAIATFWYAGTMMFGSETQSWKSLACGLATVVSAFGLLRSHFQMNQWRRTNPRKDAGRIFDAGARPDSSTDVPNEKPQARPE